MHLGWYRSYESVQRQDTVWPYCSLKNFTDRNVLCNIKIKEKFRPNLQSFLNETLQNRPTGINFLARRQTQSPPLTRLRSVSENISPERPKLRILPQFSRRKLITSKIDKSLLISAQLRTLALSKRSELIKSRIAKIGLVNKFQLFKFQGIPKTIKKTVTSKSSPRIKGIKLI